MPVKLRPQSFSNGEIHDWYRFIWGYSDHLVAGLLDEWDLPQGAKILDPFCGTGTTLVEALKRGYAPTGVDASPASRFASRTKTRWGMSSDRVFRILERVLEVDNTLPKTIAAYESDPTYSYLRDSGMLDRNWINTRPLTRSLSLKHAIRTLGLPAPYRDLFTLALLDTVVQEASNVRFGPELYVGRDRKAPPVVDAFASRVLIMACDLALVESKGNPCRVLRGDSRRIHTTLNRAGLGPYDAVVCSPPYPTEHDYTRNTRLELAFLESVNDKVSLRKIKRGMIRSHTKGIYSTDRDWTLAWAHPTLGAILGEVAHRAKDMTHGFGRLYATVVASYFGGMLRHFESVSTVMKPGAYAAYVVSDQASYANVHIPTAQILADLAEEAGFKLKEIRRWRERQSSGTSRVIVENILILRKSGR